MNQPIVLGIDGGGTTTRVMAADYRGRIVGYAEGETARLDRHDQAVQNVQSTIPQVLDQCQCSAHDVAYLVAGIAGLDSEADQVWAAKVTQLESLICPQVHVNDAVIAHAGALSSQPGIIVISGTGSVIYAVTEQKRHIRNYDMQHYANSGARHLGFAAIFEILSNRLSELDEPLVEEVFQLVGVSNLDGLRTWLTHEGRGFIADQWPIVGQIAPLVTDAALQGLPLAKRVCDKACEELATGIRVLGGHFSTNFVSVSFIGSVIRSSYMYHKTKELLSEQRMPTTFEVVDPVVDSTRGAVLLALVRAGVQLTDEVLNNLKGDLVSNPSN